MRGSIVPARRFTEMGSGTNSSGWNGGTGVKTGSGSDAAPALPATALPAPDGIIRGMLLGAGSFGRVYAGSWRGRPVAIKVRERGAVGRGAA